MHSLSSTARTSIREHFPRKTCKYFLFAYTALKALQHDDKQRHIMHSLTLNGRSRYTRARLSSRHPRTVINNHISFTSGNVITQEDCLAHEVTFPLGNVAMNRNEMCEYWKSYLWRLSPDLRG